MKSKQVYFAKVGMLLALLALAGCMSAVKKNEDASVIKQRAVQRWDYLIAHQAEKAYDFLSPGFRATKTRDAYAREMNGRGVHWSKVHFGSQKCDADVCKVHLVIDYSMQMGGPAGVVKSSGFVVETWIKTDGHWYFLPDPLTPTKLGKDNAS
ncbi:MAG TPA: hypothetical protein VFN13_01005 [Rudaea sp.]|nr:hypothetical protein [Rudaea sp.]